MIAHFYWPDCDLDIPYINAECGRKFPRTVFWIGAKIEEIEEKIQPYLHIKTLEAINDMSIVELDDSWITSGKMYFIVSWNLDMVVPWIRVFPYSGMQTGNLLAIGPPTSGPFNEPEGIVVNNLKDLLEINRHFVKKYYLKAYPRILKRVNIEAV